MKREDRRNVASVIEANTERITLKELAAKGKSHVRVISGRKVMQLIQAVVDEAIAQQVGEVTKEDRERIVQDATRRFQHVSRMHAETEALVRQQKDLLGRQQTQIKQLEKTQATLGKQLAQERRLSAEREKTARLHAETLEGAQSHLRETGERERRMTRAIRKLDQRLQNSRLTIDNYDREIDRLAGQVQEDVTLIEELQEHVREREHELQRMHGLMQALNEEVAAARARGTESETVSELRGELGEMKSFLKSLEERERAGDTTAVEALFERLHEKQAATKVEMESSFQARLDETLDHIGKALQAATAKPIDRRVEATDVVISKLFDDETDMESNLQSLDLKVSTAKQSILKSLERLKELRGSDPEEDPPEEVAGT